MEPIPYGGIPCLALMQWGGIWSCSNLMCQTLLTSYVSPYPMGGVDGRWAGGRSVGGEGEEGEL